jgi:hypothetical protein
MLSAYEIEGHGLYWEIERDGAFLSTHATLDEALAAYRGSRIAVHTHASWAAAAFEQGERFEGLVEADYEIEAA